MRRSTPWARYWAVSPAVLFGWLIDTQRRADVLIGYLIGAGLMIAAGAVAARWGVAAERRSLESVATPLSSADRDDA